MSELKVSVKNGSEYQIESLSNNQFNVNGKEKLIDLIELKEGKFNVIAENKSYNAEVVSFDSTLKEITLKVNGNNYEMKIEDRFDLLLHQLGMDDLTGAEFTELKAPMPGLVLKCDLAVGQEVKTGDPLLILEAMKMENVLKSPSDLVVKSIQVKEGEAVEKNQILIEFES